MTSLNFGWKRKATDTVKTNSAFSNSGTDDDDEEEVNLEKVDWRTLVNRGKQTVEEQPNDKKERLYDEGVALAEEERYWEAIGRWEKALEISPLDEKIHEMMSQVLMELGEIFPAVEAAEKSIKLKPMWAEAHQTLGRAQLNVGEIEKALKSFERAKHLRPDNQELWKDDIDWTSTLIERKKEMAVEMEVEMEVDTVSS